MGTGVRQRLVGGELGRTLVLEADITRACKGRLPCLSDGREKHRLCLPISRLWLLVVRCCGVCQAGEEVRYGCDKKEDKKNSSSQD
jgi:hypothetical protein